MLYITDEEVIEGTDLIFSRDNTSMEEWIKKIESFVDIGDRVRVSGVQLPFVKITGGGDFWSDGVVVGSGKFLCSTIVYEVCDLIRTRNFWEFTLKFWDGEECFATRQYQTSKDGDGLWVLRKNNWIQIAGTTQFVMDIRNPIKSIRDYWSA